MSTYICLKTRRLPSNSCHQEFPGYGRQEINGMECAMHLLPDRVLRCAYITPILLNWIFFKYRNWHVIRNVIWHYKGPFYLRGLSCHMPSQVASKSLFHSQISMVALFTRGQFWPSGIVIACVCGSVCVCINHELVRTITHRPFKLGSPNLDQRCKTPWFRSLLF